MPFKKRLPLVEAVAWIVLSTFLISGTAYQCFKAYLFRQWQKRTDPAYHIASILQTGPQKEALKTVYLAELMGISKDRPLSLFRFDPKSAQKKLLNSPVIKEAEVRILAPSTVYIDYTVRQPIAWLYDYENTVVDQEGYLFPMTPFFSPKRLPEIYLGGTPHSPVQGENFTLALELLKILTTSEIRDLFHVRRIDVSNAFLESYGKREIVILAEDEVIRERQGKKITFVWPRFLRLNTKHYAQDLGNYLRLREQLLEQECKNLPYPEGDTAVVRAKEKIIDFRIPQLAFIKNL